MPSSEASRNSVPRIQILNRQSRTVQVVVDVEIDDELETASRSTQLAAVIVAALKIGDDLRGADLYGATRPSACLSYLTTSRPC